jgi:hypothetical protein
MPHHVLQRSDEATVVLVMVVILELIVAVAIVIVTIVGSSGDLRRDMKKL